MKGIVAISIALVLASCPALARDVSEKEARKIFKQGVAAFNDGLLSDALESFKRAYALRPSFRILYNIGQVEAELRHYDLALEAFEGYLAQGGDRIEPDRKLKVENEVVRLGRLIGKVHIRGTKGGEVWIDGERKGILPLAGTIPLTKGNHELIVRLGSMRPCQKTIRVDGGERTEEICLLNEDRESGNQKNEPMNLTASKEFQVDTGSRKNGRFLSDVAPWLTAGLGAITLSTGMVCALRASSLNRSLQSTCPDGNCPPDQQNDVEKLPRLAAAADGMFITTAVFGGLSALLFAAPWKKKEKDE